jgi:hypothetical protein
MSIMFCFKILLALMLVSIVGGVISTIPVQPLYSSPAQETSDEGQQDEPTNGDQPVDDQPSDDNQVDEPEPDLPPSTSVQEPKLPDQTSNATLSGYPYPHILPPIGLTENGDEENTTQTEQTVAEKGGGNPLKGLNVSPQTGAKPLPPCTPGGPTPCLVKK